MNIDIHRLKGMHWTVVLVFIIGTIGVGLLTVWAFNPSSFRTVETFKLLLLSFALTTPSWLYLAIIEYSVNEKNRAFLDKDGTPIEYLYQVSALMGSIINCALFGCVILIKRFDSDLTINGSITLILIMSGGRFFMALPVLMGWVKGITLQVRKVETVQAKKGE